MVKRIIKYLVFLLIIIFSIFITIYVLEQIGYKCFYLELFNVYCPGCGTTRMIKSIIELDFYQAFRYNPLVFILSIIGFIYFVINSVRYISNKKLIKIPLKVIYVLLAILIIYGVLRNIPGFEFLRPVEV
ncbi:MAG: DUF2752 domain-containing protein [Bacilli bacterium]|nr:DUF2752 domain-containing protein [Bacilli bacterium]